MGSSWRWWVLVGVAGGCRTPCGELSPQVLGDDASSPALEASVAERVESFAGWLDHRCVANVYVTANAREEGERWRTDAGWSLSLLPRTAVERVGPLMCDSYAHEVRPHLNNPRFEGFDDFVESCGHGPSEALYPDQAVVCGADPWSERDRFLDEEVFVGHSVPRAPILGLDLEQQRSRPRFATRSTLVRQTVGPFEVRGDRFGVRLVGIDDTVAFDLAGEGVLLRAWTADATRLYGVTSHTDDHHSLVTVDRATGVAQERVITLPGGPWLDYDAAVAVLEGVVYVGSPVSFWTGRGQLWRIPPDGPATVVALPDPIGARTSAFMAMWPDPRMPGHVLAVHESRSVEVQGDVALTQTSGIRLIRFDPATGSSIEVPLPVAVRPWDVADVFDDGRLLVWVSTEAGRLLGVLDPDTGELRISDALCGGYAATVVDGRVVHVRSDGAYELWDVYGL